MYLVGRLLLYYLGTKKKIVSFFTSPPNCSNPPIISFWRNFQPPPPDYSKPPDYSVLESRTLLVAASGTSTVNVLQIPQYYPTKGYAG